MWLERAARRLTIFVDEGDRAPHGMKPLYTEIVHRAHEAGLAGASVFHGIEGYGASRHVHVNKVLSWSADLPVAIVIVDVPEKIDAFLPVVESLITDGLVTVDDLRAVHRAHPRGASSPEEEPDAERHRGRLHQLTHLGALARAGEPVDHAE
jgi:PII-like signaling protein